MTHALDADHPHNYNRQRPHSSLGYRTAAAALTTYQTATTA
jgi:transposase InsO family protein